MYGAERWQAFKKLNMCSNVNQRVIVLGASQEILQSYTTYLAGATH